VGHFWSYLLSSFPEMIDFLASVEENERNEFVNVIEVMYEHYFDTNAIFKCQLNDVVTDRWVPNEEQYFRKFPGSTKLGTGFHRHMHMKIQSW